MVQYRVRPSPDPKRSAETKWLSEKEINSEALKPSQKWIEIGSGNLGKVYVEIISADGLPNLDGGISRQDKSDAFAMLVFEDCCAKTDIIDDCLSPRWLPWMQRAFALNIDHPSSDLFVGVFDHDAGIAGHHDLIGRFAIELSSLRPSTTYTLSFNLYEDSFSNDRVARGPIALDFQIRPVPEQSSILGRLYHC